MRRGFTLIEVVLALTLMAVLITLVQGAYSGAVKSRNIAREETREAHEAALVLGRLSEELSMCFLAEDRRDLTGLTVDTDADGNSTLTFTTRVPPIYQFSVGGEARVRYALAEGEEEEGTDLFRQETADLQADIENAVVPYQVLPGVDRIEIECFDGQDWVTTWNSAERDAAPYLPLAVSIEVAWTHGEGDAERESVYRTSTPIYGASRP